MSSSGGSNGDRVAGGVMPRMVGSGAVCGPTRGVRAPPDKLGGGGDLMKAMVYRGPYRVRVEEKDIPPIEHPNDAIVRVSLAASCGADLHAYHGMMPDARVGMTLGHEFMGVVEEVGSSVQNLRPG